MNMHSETSRPDIVDLPDEEIHRRAHEYSFDLKEFKARTSGGERWQQLLQAHLYLDHVITRMVLEALENPKAIHADRMGFRQKVNLLSALGLLEGETVAAAKKVNSLRNGIAHRLDYTITDHTVIDLANATPQAFRKAMANHIRTKGERKHEQLQFGELLTIIIIGVEVARQARMHQRLMQRKSMAKLKAAVDEYDRLSP